MPKRPVQFFVTGLVVAFLTLTALSVVMSLIILVGGNSFKATQQQAFAYSGLSLLLSLFVGFRYARWVERSWEIADPTICPQCGYSLRGLASNRCPECGTRFDVERVREVCAEPPGDAKAR